jgi:hypothetical protein
MGQHFDVEHSAFGGPSGLDVVGNKPNGQIIERIVTIRLQTSIII